MLQLLNNISLSIYLICLAECIILMQSFNVILLEITWLNVSPHRHILPGAFNKLVTCVGDNYNKLTIVIHSVVFEPNSF